MALQLSLPPNNSRSLLLTITYCVFLFSILVQGLTISQVISHFHSRCRPMTQGFIITTAQ